MRVGLDAELSRHVCWRERDGGVGDAGCYWRRWWWRSEERDVCHVARSGCRWAGCLCRPAKTLLLHGAMLTIEGRRDELRFDGVERPQRPRWRDEDGGQRRTPRDILQAIVGYEGGDYLGGKY